jgi:hypothetical protein
MVLALAVFAMGTSEFMLAGLVPEGDWTVPRLLSLMAEACGVSPDPGRVT